MRALKFVLFLYAIAHCFDLTREPSGMTYNEILKEDLEKEEGPLPRNFDYDRYVNNFHKVKRDDYMEYQCKNCTTGLFFHRNRIYGRDNRSYWFNNFDESGADDEVSVGNEDKTVVR